MSDADVSELLGKTIVKITPVNQPIDELWFDCDDGSKYRMYHYQDCCESVEVEDIAGDLEDLIGSPLLQSEEVSNMDEPETNAYLGESYTWTFYKFATIKGSVTLRWLGTSNGYYSESISFEKEPTP